MNIGDKAPEILGRDQNGNEIKLSDFAGRKLVLYFYPKDSTSGCTAEACSLRDNYSELRRQGYEVVGVSIQDEKSHQKFIEKNQLPFNLIADTDMTLVQQMGVWGVRNAAHHVHHQRGRHHRARVPAERNKDQSTR